MLKNAVALQLPEDNSDREKNILGQLLPAVLGGASGVATTGAIQLPIALNEIHKAMTRFRGIYPFPGSNRPALPPTPKGVLMAGLLASLGAGGYVGKKVYDSVDSPANELPEFMLKSKNAYGNRGAMYPSSGMYRPEDNKPRTPPPTTGPAYSFMDGSKKPAAPKPVAPLPDLSTIPKISEPQNLTLPPTGTSLPPWNPIKGGTPQPAAPRKPPAGRYPNTRSGAPKSEFETYHGTSFDPNSTEDRAKMDALNKSRAAGPSEMRRTANAFPLHKRASAYPGF